MRLPLPGSRLLYLATALLAAAGSQAQPGDRLPLHGQELWVNGGNVAWVNFSRDIGPGTTNLAQFEAVFAETRAHGGNALRLWLHTNGSSTPEFSGPGAEGVVVGPGLGAVEDLRAILDLAFEYDVALKLCLWSFDMLQTSQYQSDADRSRTLLTDESRLQAYIEHALVPMVEGLRGHPAILAWEIFNEPEGMSTQFGWTPLRVPMAEIQRFINRTAGAIKRADPDALVTNGSWSVRASTDVGTYYNYYRDDRLVAAGGDEDGTLDFYSVHYYEHFGQAQSPFHRDAAFWGLDKPIVIAEFFLHDTRDGNPDATFGVPWQALYGTLYERGYAGAMGWQWSGGEGTQNWPRILASMRHMADTHPEAVTLELPGLRVAFSASPLAVAPGGETTLAWRVRGAETVSLNGSPVAPADTVTVTLEETTVFRLEATGGGGSTEAREITVEVVDPDRVNRALGRPALASSVETCCGVVLSAAAAFDGLLSTRWSSEWHAAYADDDPDNEWVQVDLGAVLDVTRVVLHWETAYGRQYDLQRSFDGRLWEALFEERSGTGGVDEIAFTAPTPARFLRIQGLARATAYGYSLWEFEVYGLDSTVQPPTADFSVPAEGAVFPPGADVTLTATGTAPGSSVARVVIEANGEPLAVLTEPPYSTVWPDVPPGEHTLRAAVTSAAGLSVASPPYPVYVVDTGGFTRYEAEAAMRTGDVTAVVAPSASGGAYLDMRDGGTIMFNDVEAEADGDYLLVFGYSLAYDVPKSQFIAVNGERLAEVRFNGARNAWLERGLRVPLRAGPNTVRIESSWGWMYFDYLALSAQPFVGAEPERPGREGATLAPGYPNPFRTEAHIPYTLPRAEHVVLEVFDVTGRRLAVLVDEVQPAGAYLARFRGEGLSAGPYLVRLRAGASAQTHRLLLLR